MTMATAGHTKADDGTKLTETQAPATGGHTPHSHQPKNGYTHEPSAQGRYLYLLALTALGVVYGDIGTSPLYALRECFSGLHAIAATPANIFGVLSLIFWSLLIVITIKYIVF